MLKKCLSSILLLYIVLMMMPVVEAVDTTSGAGTVITPDNFIEYGDFQVSTEDIAPTYASNKLTFSKSGSYYLKMKDGVTSSSDRIVVDGCTVNLTVEDVEVAIPADNVQGAFELRNGSTVHMTLVGDNKFLSGRAYPGIMVTPGETLNIDGDGALRAEGLNTAAGIGGSNFGDKQTAGTIIINSGTIYAKAGVNNGGGAGIGGSAGGGAGTITINGGDITAIGGSSGAGIGSGSTDYKAGGTVTIKNATIKAYGGEYDGAGIGCGGNSLSVTVSIEDSNVLAVSKKNSAGIGTGYSHDYSSALVEIDDKSEVIAVSSTRYNNAIDADTISVGGYMLMATYNSIVVADSKTAILKDGTEVVSYTPSGDYKSIAFTLPSSGNYSVYLDSILQSHTDDQNAVFNLSNTGFSSFVNVQKKAATKISRDISIDTPKPVEGELIVDGINNVPEGTILSSVQWSSDGGSTYQVASGNFLTGNDYQTQYVYKAQPGYVFQSGTSIVVSNIGIGDQTFEFKDDMTTLIVTVTWPPFPKIVEAGFIDYGDFAVSTTGIAPTYINNTLMLTASGTYHIKMREGLTSTTADRIISTGTNNIILQDVKILEPLDGIVHSNIASALEVNGHTTLTLVGKNELMGAYRGSGIQVAKDNTLIIEGDGELRAEGKRQAAGIGGYYTSSKPNSSGTIIINSGTIYAKSEEGAAIGGSYYCGIDTITINGGDITAIGGPVSAAIGSGGESKDHSGEGIITIKNASVKAYASNEIGSAIGSGAIASSVSVSIENSTVLAVGGAQSAAIGKSYKPELTSGSDNLKIDDKSVVIAVARDDSHGAIDSDNISIEGKMLMATFKDAIVAGKETALYKDGVEIIKYAPSSDYQSIALMLPSSGEYALYLDSVLQAHSGSDNHVFNVTTNGLTSFSDVQEMATSDLRTITEIMNKINQINYEDILQQDVSSADDIKNKLQSIAINTVNNGEISISVNEVKYTSAIAGSDAKLLGINGIYEFTITASKGTVSKTSTNAKVIITATPYKSTPTYFIEGNVQDDLGNDVLGATVRIMYGQDQVGQSTQTDASGVFKILNIPNGKYNIVVTKNARISTKLITIDDGNYVAGIITLPSGKKNTSVEVKDSTPAIVVGGLDDEFKASTVLDGDKGFTAEDNKVIGAGGSVEIKFIAEQKDEKASHADTIMSQATSDDHVVGLYLDLSVEKIVKNALGVEYDTMSSKLVEVPNIIDVFIPLDASMQNKSAYKVYRYHGSSVDVITTLENADHEKIEVIDSGRMLKISVRKFSTYAIAYTQPAASSSKSSSRSSSKSSDSTSSAPVVKENRISISQNVGGMVTLMSDERTVNIRPNTGYVIADVFVDGSTIGPVEQMVFSDDAKHNVSALFVESSTLPYYRLDNQKVYVGFSKADKKIYKYIVPSDMVVEFDKNTKLHTDDIPAWAKSGIEFVIERDLMALKASEFAPNQQMTRAEFIMIIGQLYERSYGDFKAENHFIDVDTTKEYAKYVAWAADAHIINGIGNNKFAPDENLTREQMAVVIDRFSKMLTKKETSYFETSYTDQDQISNWARASVAFCDANNLTLDLYESGYHPQISVTRAEVAATLEQFIGMIIQ